MSSPLSVTYQLTRDDLHAFQKRGALRSDIVRQTRKKTYLFVFLAFLFLALLPTIQTRGEVFHPVMLGLPLIGFPVLAAIMWVFERWTLDRTVRAFVAQEKPDKGLLGTHTLTLTDEGVVEKTAVGESTNMWDGVDRVEDDENYLYIYTTTSAAHIVPVRAFEDRAEARVFLECARSKIRAPRDTFASGK